MILEPREAPIDDAGDPSGAVFVVGDRHVERQGVEIPPGLDRFENQLGIHADQIGDLVVVGYPAQFLGQLVNGVLGVEVDLLDPAGHPKRPSPTEVPFDLAQNRRNGKGQERAADFGVVAIDGVEQSDECHLAQVIVGLPPSGEPRRQLTSDVLVALDQQITQLPLTGGPVPTV